MREIQLPPATHIGHTHLVVADLRRSLDFYVEKLGLGEIKREGETVTLSADGQTPRLLLTEQRGASPKPPRSTGLYHVAIRFPTRTALARAFRQLIELQWPFGGFSDHAVSEALYLADPDGNGLEMYVDRPRESWPRRGDGVVMTTQPLDIDDLVAQADLDPSPWNGVHPGTDIGHIHLHVSDLGRAKAFYVDTLGLDVAADWSGHGALFVSAGGYHHHIGLNIWAGKTPPPSDAVGLRSFQLVIPDVEALKEAATRLEAAGAPVTPLLGREDGIQTQDQDGNRVDLVIEQ